ncbi:MAG TPA: TonB-dependent receptor, partial [Variovorax sp.]|nr:TonB-dependent receptor [Variovorax sp.]
AAWGTSAQPPGGANFALAAGGTGNSASRIDFQPQEATTYEVGTKWDVLNKHLSLTAALYRTEVRNEVVQDPTTLLYYQTGKKRVQGIELGAAGAITDNWGVSAGFTTMDTSVVSGPAVTADGSNVLAYTPKNAFTLWTSYQLPFGLTIGGGARYNGKLNRGTDGAIGTPAYTDAYWVFDAMASYRINKNVELQLNVYNIFDEQYVAAINKSGYRYTPGIPRSARLTANFAF